MKILLPVSMSRLLGGRGHRVALVSLLAVALFGCGGGGGFEQGGDGGPNAPDGGGGGGGADGSTLDPFPGPVLNDEELEITSGCGGVYNPDQVLDYHIEIAENDWSQLLADQTNSIYFPAQFRCGDETPITVGIRRKRSGGASKVGLKVDFNEFVARQSYYGLRKFSLENGVSEGTTTDGAEASVYLSEYLAWRLMVLSGTISGRAVFARIHVNGETLGIYVNVEQVDKRFLRYRLGDDTGWLYKKSGGAGDGFKTHEDDGLVDPYAEYFCFWDGGGGGCPAPSAEELLQELPGRLNIEQMLRFGAVNALMGNTDGPLFKDNNYYWYDWAGGRYYLPWDLDTAMKGTFNVFLGDGIGGRTTKYTDVLFTHWEGDYADILGDLLANALALEVIHGELDRAQAVAADAFASDPYMSGTLESAVSSFKQYWDQRHAAVTAQVAAH
jgi:hypothetical protein